VRTIFASDTVRFIQMLQQLGTVPSCHSEGAVRAALAGGDGVQYDQASPG
jgi:hypothetical protein